MPEATDLNDGPIQHHRALAQFGGFALRSDNLSEILTEACRLVGEALGTELAKVMVLGAKHTIHVAAGVGWLPGVVGDTVLDLHPQSADGFTILHKVPTISRDIANETRFTYPDFLPENGVRAFVNVIITDENGEPYGILEVDSRVPRDFTGADTDFLQTYANLLGAAVSRLRLLRRLQGEITAKQNLLQEVQHRIKNNLYVITSLISMRLRRSDSAPVTAELSSLLNRIETLRVVHDHLYASGQFETIDLDPYLAELCQGLLEFHQKEGRTIELVLKLTSVSVSAEIAIPLGLIVNEFMTNSLKYAFADRGVLSVELTGPSESQKDIRLTLSDNGRGIPEDALTGGTGMMLMRGLATQINATLEWAHTEGTQLRLSLRPIA